MVVQRRRVYCKNCDKTEEVDLLLSYNSFQQIDPAYIRRLQRNIFCPVCKAKREVVPFSEY